MHDVLLGELSIVVNAVFADFGAIPKLPKCYGDNLFVYVIAQITAGAWEREPIRVSVSVDPIINTVVKFVLNKIM